MSKRLAAVALFGIAFVALLSGRSSAQPVGWPHPDGTTHYYEAVDFGQPISWTEASAQAYARGGYLASITSVEEGAHVFALADNGALWTQSSAAQPLEGPWIGLVQLPGSAEPAGGWEWTSTEPLGYSNWAAGQPANTPAGADRAHLIGTPTTRDGKWADAPAAYLGVRSFVVEWSGRYKAPTVGLRSATDPRVQPGFTLFCPRSSTEHYLIDERGRAVHSWTRPPTLSLASPYLLPNGDLLTTNIDENPAFPNVPAILSVERFDWNGNKTWSYRLNTPNLVLHHDMEIMPNGNILMIAWDLYTSVQAIAAGRDPNTISQGTIFSERIVEVQPTGPTSGNIVWEWRVWDHMIQDFDSSKANFGNVGQKPERIDLNYDTTGGISDWLHFNAVAYNPALDQIVMSSRMNSEIWIIDHSTTTSQAAGTTGGRWGKGGDLLYRYGNPLAYRGGTANDQTLFFQHNPYWIPAGYPGAGNLMIFNNGPRGTLNVSSVDEISPPTDANGNYIMTNGKWGPSTPTWTHQQPGFYSRIISGAQRQPNGNTLVCEGFPVGKMFEVTSGGQEVWRYHSPRTAAGTVLEQGDPSSGGWLFRALKYPKSYSAFNGRTLTPKLPVETYSEGLLIEGALTPHRASVGTPVDLTVISRKDPGKAFQLASSLGTGPFSIDFRVLDLTPDTIFATSVFGWLPQIFVGYAGILDPQGEGNPKIVAPASPAFVGLDIYSAFVVIDPSTRAGLGATSNTVKLTLDP